MAAECTYVRVAMVAMVSSQNSYLACGSAVLALLALAVLSPYLRDDLRLSEPWTASEAMHAPNNGVFFLFEF